MSGEIRLRRCTYCGVYKPPTAYTRAASGTCRARCEQCRIEIAAKKALKRCNRCDQPKPSSDYPPKANSHLGNTCKQCIAEVDALASTNEIEQVIDLQEGDWQSLGACVGLDPELFFPERGEPTEEAKAACKGCQVQLRCLQHAFEKPEDVGVWGGTSARDRVRIAKRRKERGSAA